MKLDSYQTVSVRSSDEILDFIGDIGGFIDSVFMIFSSFGAFFSSRFIAQSLARDMFVVKNSENLGKRKSEIHLKKYEDTKSSSGGN